MYQIETVLVPVTDQNKQTTSYTHWQINMPHIALNSETYILIRQHDFRTCKRIRYELHCEELFTVNTNPSTV